MENIAEAMKLYVCLGVNSISHLHNKLDLKSNLLPNIGLYFRVNSMVALLSSRACSALLSPLAMFNSSSANPVHVLDSF